jgi:hypothetical protein
VAEVFVSFAFGLLVQAGNYHVERQPPRPQKVAALYENLPVEDLQGSLHYVLVLGSAEHHRRPAQLVLSVIDWLARPAYPLPQFINAASLSFDPPLAKSRRTIAHSLS